MSTLKNKLQNGFYSNAQNSAYVAYRGDRSSLVWNDRTTYIKAKRAIDAEFREDLEVEYGVRSKTTNELVIPQDKADLLFRLAWDQGHIAGYQDVDSYYGEMVALVL